MSNRRELLGAPRAAIICSLLLAALVVHNGVLAAKNQRELPATEVLHTMPRSIQLVAAENRHPGVRARIANFYYLAENVPGDEILLPPGFADYAWYFERVARMRVVVGTEELVIDPRGLRELRALVREHGDYNRRWYYGLTDDGRFYQRLRVLVNHNVDRYVLAETTSGRELFVLPRKTFNGFRGSKNLTPGPRFDAQRDEVP